MVKVTLIKKSVGDGGLGTQLLDLFWELLELVTSAFDTLFILGEIRPFSLRC